MIYFGRFLRQVGKSVEARPYLNRAVDVATEAGAMWLAQQAMDELHAAGGRQAKHLGPDDLTPQERRGGEPARPRVEVRQHSCIPPPLPPPAISPPTTDNPPIPD